MRVAELGARAAPAVTSESRQGHQVCSADQRDDRVPELAET